MRFGRIALLGTAVLYVALLVWSALVLPDRVPSHFDGAGRVDDWSSRTSVLVMWVFLAVVFFIALPALTRVVTKGDGTLVSMPAHYKEYWFAPSHRAEFRIRFQSDMEFFSAVTGLLLAACLFLTSWVAVAGRDAAPGWAFGVLIGAYLLVTVIWLVWLLRAYKPPVARD